LAEQWLTTIVRILGSLSFVYWHRTGMRTPAVLPRNIVASLASFPLRPVASAAPMSTDASEATSGSVVLLQTVDRECLME
jgi:hypothetical protein